MTVPWFTWFLLPRDNLFQLPLGFSISLWTIASQCETGKIAVSSLNTLVCTHTCTHTHPTTPALSFLSSTPNPSTKIISQSQFGGTSFLSAHITMLPSCGRILLHLLFVNFLFSLGLTIALVCCCLLHFLRVCLWFISTLSTRTGNLSVWPSTSLILSVVLLEASLQPSILPLSPAELLS